MEIQNEQDKFEYLQDLLNGKEFVNDLNGVCYKTFKTSFNNNISSNFNLNNVVYESYAYWQNIIDSQGVILPWPAQINLTMFLNIKKYKPEDIYLSLEDSTLMIYEKTVGSKSLEAV